MNARRERQKKEQEEFKEANSSQPASRTAGAAYRHQEPATGLEAMMGLDDMGELEVPDHIMAQIGGRVGGGPAGMMSED